MPSARAAAANGKLFDINAVVVTGDRIPVYSLENWNGYENDALYAPMSEADIESFRQRLLKDLQDERFLFATVSVYRPSLKLGFLKLRVHVGDKGEVTVTGNQWYSAEQILESVDWETGGQFNYRSLYEDLFTLNTRPRMKVQTELKPRVDADGRRVVDVEFDVQFDVQFSDAPGVDPQPCGDAGDERLALAIDRADDEPLQARRHIHGRMADRSGPDR